MAKKLRKSQLLHNAKKTAIRDSFEITHRVACSSHFIVYFDARICMVLHKWHSPPSPLKKERKKLEYVCAI